MLGALELGALSASVGHRPKGSQSQRLWLLAWGNRGEKATWLHWNLLRQDKPRRAGLWRPSAMGKVPTAHLTT